MTGQNWREGSPAARVEGRGRFTRPLRTCRWPGLRSGWPVAAARREQAGRRRRRTAEAALRCVLGEEEGWVSCARSRRSGWRGQRGRRGCGEAGSRRRRARRRSGGAAAAFWDLGLGKWQKNEGNGFAGVLVVLVRAKDRALGCCSKPSTAAARWRPAVVCCCVAR